MNTQTHAMGTDASAVNGTPYYRQLDGLRALAVLAVLVEHTVAPSHPLRRLPLGMFGVQLFFVLSGFLITGILLRCRPDAAPGNTAGRALWAFYGRRCLRIFPLYYLVLAVLFACDYPHARETAGWHAAYLSNVLFSLRNNSLGHLGHFWSLSVEEQFYLGWPVAALLLPRRLLPPVTLGLIAAAPLYRLGMAVAVPGAYLGRLWLPFAAVDSLGAGALLALCARPGWEAFRRRALGVSFWAGGAAVALCCLSSLAGRMPRDLDTVVFPTAAGGFFFWVVGTAADGFPGWAGRLLTWAPLAYLGRISYGVYVLHYFVPDLLAAAFRHAGLAYALPRGLANLAVCLAASVALASLSWHLFESPLNRLKSTFRYAPAPPRPAPRREVRVEEEAPAPAAAVSAAGA